MRPLQALQRSRAPLASVIGHAALLTLLAIVGLRAPQPSLESALFLGELVAVAPEPAAVDDVATAAPAPDQPLDESAVPPEPPPAEPESEPQPAAPPPPSAEPRERERTLEPPGAPTPVERFAEVPEPAGEAVADVPESQPARPADDAPDAVSAPPQSAGPSLASRELRALNRRLGSWTGQFSADEPTATIAWRDDGQEYTAVLKPVPASHAMGMEQLAVELMTERDGQRLVAEMRMNRIAFSNFAQFVDRWDPNVQIHDDLIDGRFHSNTEIVIGRERGVQPVFNGKVTVAGADIRTDGVGFVNRKKMFPAGIETRVRRIALPPRAAAFDDGTVPAHRVHRIAQESLVTFHEDGTFEAQPLAGGTGAVRAALGTEPLYIVAADGVVLRVRGVVDGKVLVYSPADIVIVDDIRYLTDPRIPGADDYLGLVAERKVVIDEPHVTGPGDLEVHASIYARSRFEVRAIRSRRAGTLFLYGSLTAGSISATEPRYATRIEFDERLTTMRPPGFPLSDRYELDSTANEWRVIP